MDLPDGFYVDIILYYRVFDNLFSVDLILAIPLIFLGFTLILILMYATLLSNNIFSRFLLQDLLVLTSFIFFLTSLLIYNDISYSWKSFNFLLSWDEMSAFSFIFSVFVIIVLLLSSYSYFKYENLFTFEFSIFIFFYILGVYLLFLSNDFFSLYLAIELQSFVLYVLSAYKKDAFSSEAGLKYFVLGAFSSGVLLFGISLIYGFSGTTNFDDFYSLFFIPFTNFELSAGLIVGISFFTVGFLFKLGAFPFHMWVPDAYEGAPTVVTAILASLSKFVITVAFIKIYFSVFFMFSFYWYRIFLFLGVSSVIFATFAAIYQDKIKRLLAYSGIAHIGYVLLAVSTNTLDGLFSAYYYILVYSITSLSVFIILLSIRKYTDFLKLKTLSEFSPLFQNNPVLAFSMMILMFSLAGIPPLAGFFTKLFVFVALIDVGSYFAAGLTIVTSVIGSFYYLWIIKIIFFKDYSIKTYFIPISLFNSQIVILFLFLNIFVFLFQNFISLALVNLIFCWYF